MAHTCNPTQGGEGGSEVQGQSWLHGEFRPNPKLPHETLAGQEKEKEQLAISASSQVSEPIVLNKLASIGFVPTSWWTAD